MWPASIGEGVVSDDLIGLQCKVYVRTYDEPVAWNIIFLPYFYFVLLFLFVFIFRVRFRLPGLLFVTSFVSLPVCILLFVLFVLIFRVRFRLPG